MDLRMNLQGGQYEKNPSKRENERQEDNEEESSEKKDAYLKIWRTINPSYKDVDLDLKAGKAVSVLALFLTVVISTYLLSLDIVYSFIIGTVMIVLFLLVFHDNFFIIKNFFKMRFRTLVRIKPFEDLMFWQDKSDLKTLLISNKKDMVNIALRVFSIETIPENLKPGIVSFMNEMNRAGIAYTYQIIQTPMLKEGGGLVADKRLGAMNSVNSFKTRIYFTVYEKINGVFSNFKKNILLEKLDFKADLMKTSFSTHFSHFKIVMLEGTTLLNSLRIFSTRGESELQEQKEDLFTGSGIKTFFSKLMFCGVLLFYLAIILDQLGAPLFLVIITCAPVLLLILFLWWRDLLFQLSRLNIALKKDLVSVNPFKGMKFYHFLRAQDSLFVHIGGELLVDLKAYNLVMAEYSFIQSIERIFRSFVKIQDPIVYTTMISPIDFKTCDDEARSSMDARSNLAFLNANSVQQGDSWLNMRGGMWRSIFILSTSTHEYLSKFKARHLIAFEEKLDKSFKLLRGIFEMQFVGYRLRPLFNRKLISGWVGVSLKNKLSRLGGSHLRYLIFQGKVLEKMMLIPGELKKGIDTKLGAEFNTPTSLENEVIVGDTINTEFLESEIPAGFLLNQLKGMLISNGSSKSRELLSLKIVEGLVKAKRSSIIFDFSGNFSKLIRQFENSRFEEDFLHFKVGKAFNINFLHSGIQYDRNRIEYMDYIFEVVAMVYKKDEQSMNNIKNVFLDNQGLDLTTMALEQKNQPNWTRNNQLESLLPIFNDISQRTLSYSRNEIAHDHTIKIDSLLNNDKTVIIDLSSLLSLKAQIFHTFALLAQIIHYSNHSDDYYEKFLVIPSIDMVFNSRYLDRFGEVGYGKVDAFLGRLRAHGFGLICSANHVNYLHPSVFNHFENLAAFKATDGNDIQMLKNLLNLQEFYGKGYYSNTRNTTYQVNYLKALKYDEIIVKREDYNQSFPVLMDVEGLESMRPLKYSEIKDYMKRMDYDLERGEKKLLAQARETIFEADLGKYISYLDEIIQFFKAVKVYDKVGNVYKPNSLEALKNLIYNKARKTKKKKREILEIRDDIFEILVKKGYLAESYPRMASGSQSIRTSYKVGAQYQKALEDYFATKDSVSESIEAEVVKKETVLEKMFNSTDSKIEQEASQDKIMKDIEFRTTLNHEMGKQLVFNMFQFNAKRKEGKAGEAIDISKRFIPEFLVNLYKKSFDYSVSEKISRTDLKDSIEYLTRNKLFPFNKAELEKMMKEFEAIDSSNVNLNDVYGKLWDFFFVITQALTKGVIIETPSKSLSELEMAEHEEV